MPPDVTFFPHQLCLESLHHPLSKALVCAERLPLSYEKNLIQSFGLAHFFVLSGAHVLFLLQLFKSLKLPTRLQILFLSLYLLTCSFSAPVTRAYVDFLFKKGQPKLFAPLRSLIVFLLLWPFYSQGGSLLSLSLSSLLALYISEIPSSKSFFELKILMVSTPLYIYLFPFPHLSFLFIAPLFALFLKYILMPLAFLSLFCSFAELWLMEAYGLFMEGLSFIAEHYGLWDLKPHMRIENQSLVFICLFCSFTLAFLGAPQWRKKSFSSTLF